MYLSAADALERLMEGNRRYLEGRAQRPNQDAIRRETVAENQTPFAVILGCSDSRVPAEIVFDQGIGDLFVVRTAGHRIDDMVTASVEYAVKELRANLLLVLGHEGCGAICAAMAATPNLDKIYEPEQTRSYIPLLVQKLADVIERSRNMPGDPLENAVRENVHTVIGRLKEDSAVIEQRLCTGLEIHGAYYHLRSGQVELIDMVTCPADHP